jgi:hypothetical protein
MSIELLHRVSKMRSIMLTYQVRPRLFRHELDQPLTFPARCEVRFHFGPPQPFGVEAGGGRTLIRAV